MRIRTFPLPALLGGADISSSRAVVIDTLRMTTTATTALENGGECVFPVATVEGAKEIAHSLSALLCGERDGLKIPGFDFGNSPLEYTPKAVRGRKLIFTTTNGSLAILAAKGADRLYLGCLRNRLALANRLRESVDIALVCAGTLGQFSMEDTLTAGAIIAALPRASYMDDFSHAALALFRLHQGNVHAALSPTAHYRYLQQCGFQGDLDYCLRLDASDALPALSNDALCLV